MENTDIDELRDDLYACLTNEVDTDLYRSHAERLIGRIDQTGPRLVDNYLVDRATHRGEDGTVPAITVFPHAPTPHEIARDHQKWEQHWEGLIGPNKDGSSPAPFAIQASGLLLTPVLKKHMAMIQGGGRVGLCSLPDNW